MIIQKAIRTAHHPSQATARPAAVALRPAWLPERAPGWR